MVLETRKQSVAWMEQSIDTHFYMKYKDHMRYILLMEDKMATGAIFLVCYGRDGTFKVTKRVQSACNIQLLSV